MKEQKKLKKKTGKVFSLKEIEEMLQAKAIKGTKQKPFSGLSEEDFKKRYKNLKTFLKTGKKL